MPIRNFDERVSRDLEAASSLSASLFNDFCIGVLQSLKTGPTKEVTALIKKRNELQASFYALARIFIEAGRHGMTAESFEQYVRDNNVPDGEHTERLVAFYESNKEMLLNIIQELSPSSSLPSLVDLSWRLDVELQNRFLENELRPSFVVRIDTKNSTSSSSSSSLLSTASQQSTNSLSSASSVSTVGNKQDERSSFFEVDHPNMRFLYEELNSALRHLDGVHERRVERYV